MPIFPRTTKSGVFVDALTFIRLYFKPVATVAAENLFLRKQLGLYIERKVKPRRATDAIRFTLAQLSGLNWIATLRSSFVSVVWYTSPIPPDHRGTTEMRLYDRLQIGTLAG